MNHSAPERWAKGAVAFLVVCFTLAWGADVVMGLDALASPGWQLLPGLVRWSSPLVAAVVVRKWITHEGFSDTRLDVAAESWLHYLCAVLFGPLVILATRVLAELFGAYPAGRVWITWGAGLTLLGFVFSAVVEEFGWRGYLQPRIFPRSPTIAAVLTGVVWSMWHYQLVRLDFVDAFEPDYFDGLLWFTARAIPVSVVFGWLRERTAGITAPILAHAFWNLSASVTRPSLSETLYDAVWMGVLLAIAIPLAVSSERRASRYLSPVV